MDDATDERRYREGKAELIGIWAALEPASRGRLLAHARSLHAGAADILSERHDLPGVKEGRA